MENERFNTIVAKSTEIGKYQERIRVLEIIRNELMGNGFLYGIGPSDASNLCHTLYTRINEE